MNASPITACMRTASACTQQHSSDVGRAQPALRVRAAGFARRHWRTYWERRARRATVLILRSLDERTLHDIGISPGEIESCVYDRSGDRRHRYHESWPWRSRG
jgi:uncharacterized protein YjiS (DUF1127 family)